MKINGNTGRELFRVRLSKSGKELFEKENWIVMLNNITKNKKYFYVFKRSSVDKIDLLYETTTGRMLFKREDIVFERDEIIEEIIEELIK